MAQQVVIAGAMFEDVPSISVPDANNVYHPFLDTTIASNAAAASDIAQGKLAYVNGSLVTGTASGGGVTVEALSVTQNGTYTAPTGKADSPVTVNVSGGGGGSWMGVNATKVHTFTSEHILLKNTNFATWTYSTSATTIRAAQNYTQLTLDDQHDYIQVLKFHTHFDYGNWSPVKAVVEIGGFYASPAYRQASTYAGYKSETKNSVASNAGIYQIRTYYRNSSGTETSASSGYGLYLGTAQTPSVSNATAATPKVTFVCPPIQARGSSTYFDQTAYGNVDKDTSYIDIECEIWGVDPGTSFYGAVSAGALNVLNNGV